MYKKLTVLKGQDHMTVSRSSMYSEKGNVLACFKCKQALPNTQMGLHGHFILGHVKRKDMTIVEARAELMRIAPNLFNYEV